MTIELTKAMLREMSQRESTEDFRDLVIWADEQLPGPSIFQPADPVPAVAEAPVVQEIVPAAPAPLTADLAPAAPEPEPEPEPELELVEEPAPAEPAPVEAAAATDVPPAA